MKWEIGTERFVSGKLIQEHVRISEMNNELASTVLQWIAQTDNGFIMRPYNPTSMWRAPYRMKNKPSTDIDIKNWNNLCAVWIADKLKGELNYRDIDIDTFDVGYFTEIMTLLWDEVITDTGATQIIRDILDGVGTDPSDIVATRNLNRVNDTDFMLQAIDTALMDSKNAIADYQSGNDNALNAIVGKVMKTTKGAVDARTVYGIVKEAIEAKGLYTNT